MGDVLVIISGKGFLAYTASLPTRCGEKKRKENWTQLRTDTLIKELLNWKRALASKTPIFDSITATVSASGTSIRSSLDLLKGPVGVVSPPDRARASE